MGKNGEETRKTENRNKNARNKNGRKRPTSKQAVAIIGAGLLLLMYLAALIAAIVDRSASGRLFFVCLYATVVIPILIWVYTWLYGKITGKRTFTDFTPDESDSEERTDRSS